MKQLRNYKPDNNYNSRGGSDGRGGNGSGNGSGNGKVSPSDDPAFNDAMKKYGGMEEDELVSQLLKSVRTQRANGTYNPAQMNSYVQMLKPHLSPAQCEKLQNIIDIINAEHV